MSTPALIAMRDGDVIRGVYCHWDGYPDEVGRLLYEHYGIETTRQLLELGNLSSLEANISTSVFYCRDRGEDFNSNRAIVRDNFDDMLEYYATDFAYYLDEKGHWWYTDYNKPLTPLADFAGHD